MRYIVTTLGFEIASSEVLRTQSDFLIVLSGFFPTWYTWEGISYAFLGVFTSMSWGNFPNCELIWEGLHDCGWYHACVGHIRCFSVNLEEQANKQRSSMLFFFQFCLQVSILVSPHNCLVQAKWILSPCIAFCWLLVTPTKSKLWHYIWIQAVSLTINTIDTEASLTRHAYSFLP